MTYIPIGCANAVTSYDKLHALIVKNPVNWHLNNNIMIRNVQCIVYLKLLFFKLSFFNYCSRAGAPSAIGSGFSVSTGGIGCAMTSNGPRDLSVNAGPPVVIPICLWSSDKRRFLLLRLAPWSSHFRELLAPKDHHLT